MPAWLLTLLLKYALPLLITWLQKEGYIDAAEALIAKGGAWTIAEVKTLKTYPQYPGDPPAPTGSTNMTTGDGTPVT